MPQSRVLVMRRHVDFKRLCSSLCISGVPVIAA
jgi:hypothetical protein